MNYTVSPCVHAELPQVYALINARIRWMDEMGLDQWNTVNYWDAYPESHYEDAVTQGCLYVIKDLDRIVGALVLRESDPYWDDSTPACYFHNFATALDAKGAGKKLLDFCAELALKKGKQYLRMDCAVSNQKLNEYYENLGFALVGDFWDDVYHANKRQKLL